MGEAEILSVEAGRGARADAGLRLPDFLIIGAAKSGTTSLFTHLGRHPRVFLPEEKEPSFFARDERFSQGLASYAALFRDARPGQLCGEASTEYTRWPEVPEPPARIRAALPDVKLIYVMRHPVHRAYSHYVHRYTKELYKGQPITWSFEQHVARDPMCVNSSLYMKQIERYLAHFPRESLLCLLTEDLDRRPERVLRRVCDFLGLDYRDSMGEAERANVSGRYLGHRAHEAVVRPLKAVPGVEEVSRLLPNRWRQGMAAALHRTPWGRRVKRRYQPPPMTPQVRQKYLSFFAEMVDAVEQFLGRDLSDWRR